MIDNYLNAVGEEHVRELAGRIARMLREELPGLDRSFGERAVAAAALASAAQRLDAITATTRRPCKAGGVTGGLVLVAQSWQG